MDAIFSLKIWGSHWVYLCAETERFNMIIICESIRIRHKLNTHWYYALRCNKMQHDGDTMQQEAVRWWWRINTIALWCDENTIAVFYLKFFEHPSFGQVAHEIYPSEWKVHSSEISITIMYCWYMFLMAVATDFTHVTINLVCCCLSPVLISHKRSCWKISQSLKPIWLDVEMLVPLFFKNQSVLQRCQSNFRAIGRLEEA